MSRQLPWLQPGEAFPPVHKAWGPHDPAPGLLAGGGVLDTDTLQRAYSHGVFPWFSEDQPVLWWSPDPRMVLHCDEFIVRRSLRQAVRRFQRQPGCEIRFDHAFADVISACANSPRAGQQGTWIVPQMQEAYLRLHQRSLAHSVETWIDGQLAGGLYCVNIGHGVFGESMFARVTDASKIALAALVCFCRAHGLRWIDCQQQTQHLASLGARALARSDFIGMLQRDTPAESPVWTFQNTYWNSISEFGQSA